MTPENPEALVTIIVAGIGYGIYIGGEALDKRRVARSEGRHLPEQIVRLIRDCGGAMLVLPVLLYVGLWALVKI